jgi:hypothetical protein
VAQNLKGAVNDYYTTDCNGYHRSTNTYLAMVVREQRNGYYYSRGKRKRKDEAKTAKKILDSSGGHLHLHDRYNNPQQHTCSITPLRPRSLGGTARKLPTIGSMASSNGLAGVVTEAGVNAVNPPRIGSLWSHRSGHREMQRPAQ